MNKIPLFTQCKKSSLSNPVLDTVYVFSNSIIIEDMESI